MVVVGGCAPPGGPEPPFWFCKYLSQMGAAEVQRPWVVTHAPDKPHSRGPREAKWESAVPDREAKGK